MAWSHIALCNRISRIIGDVTHKPVTAGGICQSTSKREHPPAGEGRQQAPANSSAVRVIDAAHQAPNGKAQQSAERSRQKRRGGIRSMIPTAPILDRRMQGKGVSSQGRCGVKGRGKPSREGLPRETTGKGTGRGQEKMRKPGKGGVSPACCGHLAADDQAAEHRRRKWSPEEGMQA